MEIKQMKYFISIAQNGSLAAAAETIGIAQPSLTHQVKKLEEELGVTLLVRSSRGVTLTEAGSILLKNAQSIVEAVRQAQEDVRLAGEAVSGSVIFGFPSSVCMVLSVPLAETILNDYPLVRFRAVEAMSGFIKDWLNAGSIDMGILYDMNNLRNIESRLLMTEDLHFYAAADNWPLPEYPGEPVTLRALADLDLVLPSKSHGLRMLIDRVCKSTGHALKVVVEMDSLSQIKTLVARGSAYTILAPASVNSVEQSGDLVGSRIVNPVIRRPVFLVRSAGRKVTRVTREVEALTCHVVEDLVRRGIWTGRLATAD